MEYNLVYKKTEQYVTELFDTAPMDMLVYHNLQHTKSVVGRAQEISSHYNLNEREILVLFIAAWFHDTGYLVGEPLMHEERGAQLMRDFMKDKITDPSFIEETEDCILATKGSNQPKNLLQQIIVDADTYHFGTTQFKETNKQVYKEFVLRNGYTSKEEWNRQAIGLLESHHFYTSYCKELLTEQKMKNLKKLRKKQDELAQQPAEHEPPTMERKAIKAANNLTTKGIQTMLRLTSENHMKLSDMADGKANILISVNAIIISVILSVLMRKLQVDTYLTIPTILFLVSSVATIVIAILATRPKINQGTFRDQDVIDKKTNLLFFGNFYRTQQEDYEKAMSKMMVDPEYLYTSLVQDIYHLGVVLGRKYRLIRLAYNIFMIGIIVSVLAFGIASLYGTSLDGVVTNAEGAPL